MEQKTFVLSFPYQENDKDKYLSQVFGISNEDYQTKCKALVSRIQEITEPDDFHGSDSSILMQLLEAEEIEGPMLMLLALRGMTALYSQTRKADVIGSLLKDLFGKDGD